MIIPRFAKMGSTKLDILNKMYDELMSDKQVNTMWLDLDCSGYNVLGNYKNFPSMLCHFKFMDSAGKTFPPSTIVRKYKKVYDSMSPDDFMKWICADKKMVIFYC